MELINSLNGDWYHIAFTILLITSAVVMFSVDQIPIEITAITMVGLLVLFFYIFPVFGADGENLLSTQTLLHGFANTALATIISLLVIGEGLLQTGALNKPTSILVGFSKKSPFLTLSLTFVMAGVFSAFLNNTPVVVLLIPTITLIAFRIKKERSQVLMPLSFIAILGGMTTLIGSSTNILVNEIAVDGGAERMGLFSYFVPGTLFFVIGSIYCIFLLPKLLKKGRSSVAERASYSHSKQFIAEIPITEGHELEGVNLEAGRLPNLSNLTIRVIQRGEMPILPPFDENMKLRAGDLMVITATRVDILEALTGDEDILSTVIQHDEEKASGFASSHGEISDNSLLNSNEIELAEAIISPNSKLIGKTVQHSNLRKSTSCIVLGIGRRARMYRSSIQKIKLEAGDVMLMIGPHQRMLELRKNPDIILLDATLAEIPDIKRAELAFGIFLTALLSAAFGILPIVISALLGAIAMLITGCIDVRKASRAFDRKIYLLIGTALAMNQALYQTGGAEFIASTFLDVLEGQPIIVILSAMFLLIAVLTNFLSNNATAALFTPIALSTANKLGVPPDPFIHMVIFAANCSFATPIAYQTNLLVMGPAQYRFKDFLIAGTPLVIIIWVAFTLFAPYYYNL